MMLNRLPMLLTSVTIGIVFAAAALVMVGSEAKARSMTAVMTIDPMMAPPANEKVLSLLARLDSVGSPTVDQIGSAIGTVRTLLKDNQLRNGGDYLNAAMVAARGSSQEDALLTHDLAVCALAMGETRAKEWVAYSQDQFLIRVGHKQRYGTQAKEGKILPTATGVPDSIRFILGVPSLLEAQRKVERGETYTPARFGTEKPVAAPND